MKKITNNTDLEIKKLNLGFKIIKKKFFSQLKLLKRSPKYKISHVFLRNTLMFHNIVFKVKKSDFMNDCIK